ncbi:hypothetical protein NL676_032829 [Syzygium grande]|nr:hypothetical protein NL676_032829 [Syzygium grande]
MSAIVGTPSTGPLFGTLGWAGFLCRRENDVRAEPDIAEPNQFQILIAAIRVLKKAGCPSERLVSDENCTFKKAMQHECGHLREITEAEGTEEAEADAEYDNALNEAIRGLRDAVRGCEG